MRLSAPGVYTLLSDASTTGEYERIQAGSYLWAASADDWNGATASLDDLAEDGTTAISIATLSATGAFSEVIDVGEGSQLRVSISGSPTGLTSRLRAIA